MGVKITKAIVEAVKGYAKKYPNMTQLEIGKLVEISNSSVSYILNGQYDHLLIEPEEKVIRADIPYETYRRLVCCELAMNDIINHLIISRSTEDCLFIDYRLVDSVVSRYLPEEYSMRCAELYGNGDEEE